MAGKPRFGAAPVAFDDYYSLLKEFVASADAQRCVAEYDRAIEGFRAEGKDGDPLEDRAVHAALRHVRGVAYTILVRHGYQSRLEVVESKEKGTSFRPMNTFAFVGEMFIRGKTMRPLEERSINIDVADDVRTVLRDCACIESIRPLIPVEPA